MSAADYKAAIKNSIISSHCLRFIVYDLLRVVSGVVRKDVTLEPSKRVFVFESEDRFEFDPFATSVIAQNTQNISILSATWSNATWEAFTKISPSSLCANLFRTFCPTAIARRKQRRSKSQPAFSSASLRLVFILISTCACGRNGIIPSLDFNVIGCEISS